MGGETLPHFDDERTGLRACDFHCGRARVSDGERGCASFRDKFLKNPRSRGVNDIGTRRNWIV